MGNTLGNTFGQHPPLFWATLLGNTLRKFGQRFLATHTLYLGNTFWQHTLKFSLVQLWLCHLLQNIMLAICIGIHDGLAKQNWWHLTADVSGALGQCCNNRKKRCDPNYITLGHATTTKRGSRISMSRTCRFAATLYANMCSFCVILSLPTFFRYF